MPTKEERDGGRWGDTARRGRPLQFPGHGLWTGNQLPPVTVQACLLAVAACLLAVLPATLAEDADAEGLFRWMDSLLSSLLGVARP